MTKAVKCDICGAFEDQPGSTEFDFTLAEVGREHTNGRYDEVHVRDMCEACRRKLHELYRAEVKPHDSNE